VASLNYTANRKSFELALLSGAVLIRKEFVWRDFSGGRDFSPDEALGLNGVSTPEASGAEARD
jgi:hypothetical protein